jgi:hypothetical protein
MLQRPKRFLVNIAGFDAVRSPLAQAFQMLELQVLLNRTHRFLLRDKIACLGRILGHHDVQRELRIGKHAVVEITDFRAALLGKGKPFGL